MKMVIPTLALVAFMIGAFCSCSPKGAKDEKGDNPSKIVMRNSRDKEGVTGRVGEGFYDDRFQNESSFECLIEYTVTNTTPNDLVFDRVEQHWLAGGNTALSLSTAQPRGTSFVALASWRDPVICG